MWIAIRTRNLWLITLPNRASAKDLITLARNLKELAKREQVYCKLSGLATEADYENWTEGELFPYMEITMEAFGPERVMFGSDWPACLVAATYKRWFDTASRYIDQLSETEQQQIWHQTAQEAYHFALPSETT